MSLSPAYEKYPDHTLEFDDKRLSVRVSVGEILVAESARGLSLREGRYPTVVYVPREDVKMEHFGRSEHSTHCPFKGDATYFDFMCGEEGTEQVAWSYEDPFDQMESLREHLAFYPDRARIEVLED